MTIEERLREIRESSSFTFEDVELLLRLAVISTRALRIYGEKFNWIPDDDNNWTQWAGNGHGADIARKAIADIEGLS